MLCGYNPGKKTTQRIVLKFSKILIIVSQIGCAKSKLEAKTLKKQPPFQTTPVLAKSHVPFSQAAWFASPMKLISKSAYPQTKSPWPNTTKGIVYKIKMMDLRKHVPVAGQQQSHT